jgi:hypothetical protein
MPYYKNHGVTGNIPTRESGMPGVMQRRFPAKGNFGNSGLPDMDSLNYGKRE